MSTAALLLNAALLAIGAMAVNTAAAAEGNGMNVLFIASDDLRPDIAGLYGNPQVFTPNIDRLMQNGVTFTHSYTQCPICSPSRTSFLTGLRPDTTRVWTIGPYFRETMPDNTGLKVITLPQYFKQHGYYTVGGGKIFHPGISSGGPSSSEGGADEPYSWSEPYFFCDQFYNATFQSPAMQNWPNGTGCVQDEECITCLEEYGAIGNASFKPAFVASSCPSKCYPEGAVANHIRSKLGNIAQDPNKQPFFVAAGLKRPHLGWMAPQAYFDAYDPDSTIIAKHREPPINMPPVAYFQNNSEMHSMQNFRINTSLAYTLYVGNENVENITAGYYSLVVDDYHSTLRSAYYAAVSWMDDQLGEILDALQENGFWNNTIIVFVGDHGYHLGELGAWCKNTPYEQSGRVPTVFRIPGQMKQANGGFAVDDIIEMVDIYPTLVEAAGLKANRANEGSSVLSYINGHNGAEYRGDNVAYTQTFNLWFAPNGTVYNNVMALSMRMNGWRYTEYVEYNWTTAQPLWENGNNGVELYNHTESTENDYDSYENYNLAYDEEYSDMVQEMHAQLVKNWPYGPNTTQIYPTQLYVSPEVSLYD